MLRENEVEQMTRLSEIVNTMLIKADENGYCVGDINHNNMVLKTFEGVKSNKFNIEVAQYIQNNIGNNGHDWYWYNFSKGQLLKLRAIMNAKSKSVLQKRVLAFSKMITNGYYAHIFNQKQISEWYDFCNKHNLEHGLIKIKNNI